MELLTATRSNPHSGGFKLDETVLNLSRMSISHPAAQIFALLWLLGI